MDRLELFEAVQAMCHRNDLRDFFDTALKMGESIINQRVRATEMVVFGSIDTSVPETYPGAWLLPADFLEMRDVVIPFNGGRQRLRSAGRDEISDWSYSTGRPQIYSIYDGVIEFRPVPSAVIDVIYFGRLPALVEDDDTNLVLTSFPELYIWAVLVGVYAWTQNDQQHAAAMAKFNEATASVNDFAENARFGAGMQTYTGRRFGTRGQVRWA